MRLYSIVAVVSIIALSGILTSSCISEKKGDKTHRELMTLKLRYKLPNADKSKKVVYPIVDTQRDFDQASHDFRFAASVASFGMLLRDSEHKGSSSFDRVAYNREGVSRKEASSKPPMTTPRWLAASSTPKSGIT